MNCTGAGANKGANESAGTNEGASAGAGAVSGAFACAVCSVKCAACCLPHMKIWLCPLDKLSFCSKNPHFTNSPNVFCKSSFRPFFMSKCKFFHQRNAPCNAQDVC